MSVPNQKIVVINKPSYTEKFLQIGISEWQQARCDMNYSTFCLYLYLAGNMNGFNLELSKEAFENAAGFKKTSYHDGLKKLQELGYLVHAHGNKWLFYTSPVRFGGNGEKDTKTDIRTSGFENPEKRPAQPAQANDLVRSGNTEIDNIDKRNKINNQPALRNECANKAETKVMKQAKRTSIRERAISLDDIALMEDDE